MAYTHDSKSCAARLVGSSPTSGTSTNSAISIKPRAWYGYPLMPTTKESLALLATAHIDYSRALNVHAYYRLSNRQVSEDLVQDAFVKTWRYLLKGGEVATMKSFLYHVVDNLIIDQYRKHKTSSLDLILDTGVEFAAPDERIADVLDGKAAMLMIAQLPLMYKNIMTMKYIQQLTVKEMATATGYSENTIAVQAHRGLLKLKKLHEAV